MWKSEREAILAIRPIGIRDCHRPAFCISRNEVFFNATKTESRVDASENVVRAFAGVIV